MRQIESKKERDRQREAQYEAKIVRENQVLSETGLEIDWEENWHINASYLVKDKFSPDAFISFIFNNNKLRYYTIKLLSSCLSQLIYHK